MRRRWLGNDARAKIDSVLEVADWWVSSKSSASPSSSSVTILELKAVAIAMMYPLRMDACGQSSPIDGAVLMLAPHVCACA